MMTSDKTNHILNSMLFPIKNNILFFVFMYLLGAVCIIFEPFAWYGSRVFSLLELCIDDYIVCLFIELFPRKVKNIISFIICFILYSIAIIDMTCYVRLGVGIHPIYFQTFVHSNIHETSEMLHTYLSPSVIFSPLLLIVLLVILHIFICLKKTKLTPTLPDGFKKTIKIIVTLLLLISLITSLSNKKYFFYRVICQMSELEFQEKFDMTPLTGYYLPVYRLAYSISEYNILKPVTQKIRHTLLDKTEHVHPVETVKSVQFWS